MLELFPEGFEELEVGETVELAGYATPAEAASARAFLAGYGEATTKAVEPGWDTASTSR